jgi:hypothetical protein
MAATAVNSPPALHAAIGGGQARSRIGIPSETEVAGPALPWPGRSIHRQDIMINSGSSFPIALAFFAVVAGTGGAAAQSVGADEAVRADGTMSQKLALTPAQEQAIYNAVIGQPAGRSDMSMPGVQAAIGAPVPQAVELREIPDQAAMATPWPTVLRYAMVEGAVVLVDPIGMRVVDVIRNDTVSR